MKIVYSFDLIARCPSDRLPDLYRVRVETGRVIFAETIVAYIAKFDTDEGDHLSQEAITEDLARHFAARVTTTGVHYGIAVECVA